MIINNLLADETGNISDRNNLAQGSITAESQTAELAARFAACDRLAWPVMDLLITAALHTASEGNTVALTIDLITAGDRLQRQLHVLRNLVLQCGNEELATAYWPAIEAIQDLLDEVQEAIEDPVGYPCQPRRWTKSRDGRLHRAAELLRPRDDRHR